MNSQTIIDMLPDMPDIEDMGGNQDHLDLIEKVYDMVPDCLELYDSEGWKLVKRTPDATLWRIKTDGSSLDSLKREMEVNASVQDVYDFFTDEDSITQVNDKCLSNKHVEYINDDSFFAYREYEGMLVVANRDLSAFIHKIHLEDGSKIVVSFSVEHNDIPKTSAVRVEVHAYFLYLKPISDDRTKVMSIIKVDPQGSIPTFFVNLMSSLQLDEFVKTKELIEKKYA